ncbi:DUF4815 domain-containing protein [Delftia acidovorans]|uniref:DUF4815 domain-containing protein n=1 Tax=Delftia acidovorans TaxID=80866 RepID=UPI001EDF6BA5|nr:DUF4815 domain-containing protein [Delftia acidovorans]MCG3785733.1 DUF4815 domain-containing protein [Delftia acidovorans]
MTSYNRHDPAKGYTQHIFHADRVAQSAEPNEMQAQARYALRRVADVLFADGDITAGARCSVNAETGACQLEAGSIYLNGAVHDVAAAALQIAVQGTVYIGVHYATRIVTAEQDPTLYNPAVGTSGYGEPGADRLQVSVTWGLQGQGEGDFYPVWTVEDGIVKPREPAPQLNAVTKAIEGYDRDSTGGTYVVRGLKTLPLPDDDQGRQVYAITAGAARVGGVAIEVPADRRLVYAAEANMAQVNSEPHSSSTDALQHVAFDRWPVLEQATLRITRRKTAQVVHGSFVGAADPLPDASVVQINSVTQGGTTYTKDVDYKLTAGQIDWSPAGAEPTPGSTYSVGYDYISTEPAQNQTTRGFEVQGALPATLILVDYRYALRRIDRIVMGSDGLLNVVKGIPATWQPVPPDVPGNVLALGSIYQTWEPDTRRTEPDSVRLVPMPTLVAYRDRMDRIELDLAELRLATDTAGRYSGLKKGYFADPMMDDSMRDQGLEQTAMIAGGALQLYEADNAYMLGDGKTAHSLEYTLAKTMGQTATSRAMKINAQATAGALPASIELVPSVDRWEVPQALNYPRVVSFYRAFGATGEDVQAQYRKQIKEELLDLTGITMRPLEVQFALAGFRALEAMESLHFDGLPVAAQPLEGGGLVANAAGVLEGKFTIPEGLPVGAKTVEIKGEHGTTGRAQYVGSATLNLKLNVLGSNSYGSIFAGFATVTYVI